MSDSNVSVPTVKSLESTKDGIGSSAKGAGKVIDNTPPVKAMKPVLVKQTDLNYSINQKDNSLHLTVKGADGEVVREMVFDRFNPNLLDMKKLKGVFIDDNS